LTSKTVALICGTRPEAIKLAPLMSQLMLERHLQPVLIATGQHSSAVTKALESFGLEPNIGLRAEERPMPVAERVGLLITSLDLILRRVSPSVTVVQGDTSSCVAGAIAAFYNRIPVTHLEAGLRTGDLASPFPEEGNRKIVAGLAALHLAPTPTAKANLVAEGIRKHSIATIGNTAIDALIAALRRNAAPAWVTAMSAQGRPVICITMHRRENWPALPGVAGAMRDSALRHPEAVFFMSAHPNPEASDGLIGALGDLANVLIRTDVAYKDFVHVLARSALVVTDSGGIQEEASALGRPTLVLRQATERREGLGDLIRLIGTEPNEIVRSIDSWLILEERVARASTCSPNPYGDGHASDRAIAAIRELLGEGKRIADFVPPGLASMADRISS